MESVTDVLKGILSHVVNEEEEICWPSRDPNALSLMEKAKEDKDKPGLEAMLQKVLQLYASRVLSKRSYVMKGDEVLKAEQCLEEIIKGAGKNRVRYRRSQGNIKSCCQ
ncbi:hypothetical protein Hanom_Chr13g01222441 [Helianthus anomalus]